MKRAKKSKIEVNIFSNINLTIKPTGDSSSATPKILIVIVILLLLAMSFGNPEALKCISSLLGALGR